MPVSIQERITTGLPVAKVQNQQQIGRICPEVKMDITEAITKIEKRVEGISYSHRQAIAKTQVERLKAKLLTFELQLQQVL
jgi:hypothetical protein